MGDATPHPSSSFECDVQRIPLPLLFSTPRLRIRVSGNPLEQQRLRPCERNTIKGLQLFKERIQTVANIAGIHRDKWVENADRWIAGFLEMFEDTLWDCHQGSDSRASNETTVTKKFIS